MQKNCLWALLLVFLLGCSSILPTPIDAERTGEPPLTRTLAHPTPSATPLPTATPEPSPTLRAERRLLPSPTATPRAHIIAPGEDLTGIAIRYGLTVDELRAANPDVNPNLMIVGETLLIPQAQPSPAPIGQATPTALPVTLSGPDCYAQADGSLICLALAQNEGEQTLENLAIKLRVGLDQGPILEEEAYGLLDLLPPGLNMPFELLFSPPVPANPLSYAEINRAYPQPGEDTRYAALEEVAVHATISADGLSAVVEGKLRAVDDTGIVWLAAWAVDSQGGLVAVRRWEGGALQAGTEMPFSLILYSLGGRIETVHWRGEAKR